MNATAQQALITALTGGETERRNRFEQALRDLGPGVELEPYAVAVTYRGETLRVPMSVWHNVREIFEGIPLASTEAQAGSHFWKTLVGAEALYDARMMAAEARGRKRAAQATQRRFARDLAYCIALSDAERRTFAAIPLAKGEWFDDGLTRSAAA